MKFKFIILLIFLIKLFDSYSMFNILTKTYNTVYNLIQEANRNYYNANFTLIHAIVKGNTETAKELIKIGVNLNLQDDKGNTPLILAVIYNNIEIVRLLVQAGALVNIKCQIGYTALNWAVSSNNKEMVKILLANSADINNLSNKKQTPLINALDIGFIQMAELLINAGANLNIQDIYEQNALSFAIKKTNKKFIQLLFEKDVNVNHDININNNVLNKKKFSNIAKKNKNIKVLIRYINNLKMQLNNALEEANFELFKISIKKLQTFYIEDENKNNLIHKIVKIYDRNLVDNIKINLIKILAYVISFVPDLIIKKNNLNLNPIEYSLQNDKSEIFRILIDKLYKLD